MAAVDIPEHIKVKKKGQMTIPATVRDTLGIHESDVLELNVVNGNIVLTPMVTIPKDQAWFWEPEWQAAEREAQEDIDNGNYVTFSNAEDLIASLRSEE